LIAAPGRQPALSQEEEEFLLASVRARRNAVRRGKIVRRGFAVLTAGLAVAVVATLTSLASANRDLNAANVQQMSAESVALRDIDPAVSELAAADAWHSAPSDQTRDLGIEAAANPLIAVFDASDGQVAVSPDGSMLAISDVNGTVADSSGGADVTLWSVRERKVLAYITPPSGAIAYSVAFSPVVRDNVHTLAVGTSDGVALYKIVGSSYRLTQVMQAGTTRQVLAAVDPVAFRTDGMLAVKAAEFGGDILLFPDANGRYPSRPAYALRNTQDVQSLSFGPDGSLAAGTSDGVRVYSADNGYSSQPVTIGRGTEAAQQLGEAWGTAQFGAAGLLMVNDSSGTYVERSSGRALANVPLRPGAPSTDAALSDRNVLAVAETDGLHLYVAGQSAADGFFDMLTVPYPGRQKPEDVAFTPDGNALIENIGGTVYVYDTRVLIGTLNAVSPTPDVQQGQVMDFDPADSANLATVTPAGVDFLNVSDGQVTLLPGTAGVTWATFAPDGELAIVIGGRVRLFPAPLTEPGRSILVPGIERIDRVIFSSTGAMAVSRSSAPFVLVYPPGNYSASAMTVVSVQAPGVSQTDLGVEDAAFGPGGQLAVVLTSYAVPGVGGVAVLAPGSYAEQGFIADSALAQNSDDGLIAFAPDGTLAIGNEADIQLYAPGRFDDPKVIVGVHSGYDSGYGWLAFGRGGILLSADSLSGASLWDYKSGQNLGTFSLAPEERFGKQLAVSPDGKYFAYENGIGYDSNNAHNADVVTVWLASDLDGDVTDSIRDLCGQLGGAPDSSQWRQYFVSGLPYPRICG
jgi:WD40 repeat protein